MTVAGIDAAVIWNPRSGTRADVRVADQIQSILLDAGVHSSFAVFHPGSNVADIAREAVAKGASTVIACGGDGTVSGVASALVGTNAALGVLPTGTLNHFAKDLQIPLELEGAARVIANGNTVQVDIGEVNGRTFINNSSLGMYPTIVMEREQHRRMGLNKWLALGAATLRVLKRYPFIDVRIEVKGEPTVERTPFVFVGNNEYEIEGLNIGRRASLRGGSLCIYWPATVSRAGLVLMALAALMRRINQTEKLRTVLTRECHIESRGRHVRVSIDGEVVQLRMPLHYVSRQGALRVLVP